MTSNCMISHHTSTTIATTPLATTAPKDLTSSLAYTRHLFASFAPTSQNGGDIHFILLRISTHIPRLYRKLMLQELARLLSRQLGVQQWPYLRVLQAMEWSAKALSEEMGKEVGDLVWEEELAGRVERMRVGVEEEREIERETRRKIVEKLLFGGDVEDEQSAELNNEQKERTTGVDIKKEQKCVRFLLPIGDTIMGTDRHISANPEQRRMRLWTDMPALRPSRFRSPPPSEQSLSSDDEDDEMDDGMDEEKMYEDEVDGEEMHELDAEEEMFELDADVMFVLDDEEIHEPQQQKTISTWTTVLPTRESGAAGFQSEQVQRSATWNTVLPTRESGAGVARPWLGIPNRW